MKNAYLSLQNSIADETGLTVVDAVIMPVSVSISYLIPAERLTVRETCVDHAAFVVFQSFATAVKLSLVVDNWLCNDVTSVVNVDTLSFVAFNSSLKTIRFCVVVPIFRYAVFPSVVCRSPDVTTINSLGKTEL